MNVQHIETEASDHSSLMLSSDVEPIRKIKQFYFDRRWIESEGVQILFQKLDRMIVMALRNLKLALKSYIFVELWRELLT